jgi:hypothetical protein
VVEDRFGGGNRKDRRSWVKQNDGIQAGKWPASLALH